MTKKQVVVIGGGFAGLAAAKRLTEAGFGVTVLEKRPLLGGKWSAWQDADGDWIETGLHVFFGAYDEIFTLMKELGTYEAIQWKAHRMIFTLAGGQRYDLEFAPLPGFLSTAPTLFRNRYFTLLQKLSLIRAGIPLFLGGQEYVDAQDGISYAEWHAQHGIHDQILQKMFVPVSLATKFVAPADISAKLVIEISRLLMGKYEHSRIGMLRGSPETYISAPLRAAIEARGGTIRTDARVAAIETAADGRATGVTLDSGESLPCDYLLTALPIHNLKRLIPKVWQADPYFAGLMKLEGAPVITLHLWLDRIVGGIDHLLFTPDGILPVYADMAQTTPDYRNERTVGSRFQFVVAPAADLMPLKNEEIIERVMGDLRRLFPEEMHEAQIRKATVVRVPQSVYFPRPGTDPYRVLQTSPIPNVFVAGGYTLQRYYDSMEGAVRSGNRAAAALIARDAGQEWVHTL